MAAYRAHLVDAAGDALRGLRIGLDCANGSASVIAPDLFRELGAEVTVINAEPDGTNINLDAGSSHPQGLADAGGRASGWTWASPSTATPIG